MAQGNAYVILETGVVVSAPDTRGAEVRVHFLALELREAVDNPALAPARLDLRGDLVHGRLAAAWRMSHVGHHSSPPRQ
jgi:hypothetical protein